LEAITISAPTEAEIIVPYEQRLKHNRSWSMDEGDHFFQRDDSVFKTLRKIASRMDALGVPYAIAGGMSLNAHGFRRLTVDVDILVTRAGLTIVHEKLEGLGYAPPFSRTLAGHPRFPGWAGRGLMGNPLVRMSPKGTFSLLESEFPLAFGLDNGSLKEYNLLGDNTG
jgi:hypothetical protein